MKTVMVVDESGRHGFLGARRATGTATSAVDSLRADLELADPRIVALVKEFDSTWTNGKIQSNLDHVLASSGVKFKNLGVRTTDGVAYQVAVRGWHQLTGANRANFIGSVSDHCALQCEITF